MNNKIGTNLEQAKLLLEKNELVAIPTETVYGLAANALHAEAVAKIFAAKNRPNFDPLIVHTHSIENIEHFTQPLEPLAQRLAEAFMPGPLTLLIQKKEIIPDLVTAGSPWVGIRIPKHDLTLNLLKNLSFPVAAPSANPFGFVSPTTAQHVADQLGDKISYILDGGPAKIGLESTVVKVENNEFSVLRLGGLTLEELEEVAGKKVASVKTSSSNPAAPGMLSSHYNPGKKVVFSGWTQLQAQTPASNLGAIVFTKKLPNVLPENQFVLSETGNVNEAAANLFTALRWFSAKNNISTILAESFEPFGLGRAINDRLKRASV